jgi:CRP-like cAMP-binding protein
VSPLAPLLAKLERWMPLSEDDRQAVLALPYRLRSFDAHQYIVREGDRADQSMMMVGGLVLRHKVVGDGGRQIVGVQMRGDAIDLHNSLLRIADHNVQALTAAEVAAVPRAAIIALAYSRPAVGQAMWIDTLVDASISREWTANVGRRDARARMAHLLCEFAVRMKEAGLGGHLAYELPMTQEQLADVLGLTPVHVNRTLKALEGEGLIERTKKSVTIGDWRRLVQAGDFESRYLHLNDAAA